MVLLTGDVRQTRASVLQHPIRASRVPAERSHTYLDARDAPLVTHGVNFIAIILNDQRLRSKR